MIETLTFAEQDARATELMDRFCRLPDGHPRRAAARERAIEAWLPMARHLARRYAGRGEPMDDLVQVAVVGLIKAVDRYEPGRGTDFAAFAIPTVVGEIKRHFRDRTWSVRVPRRLQELRQAISAAASTLTHDLGRSPTVADVAAHLGVTEEEVIEGLEGARAYRATSLSTPVGAGETAELGDLLGGADEGYALIEARVALKPALATLSERERTILTLRFFGNLTQSQIAQEVGISQMHVSRLITKSLETLREHLS
ncbi:RNA polymerase sigma factor SigF [Actinoplanes sp. N902-109]|uniref:RNA polymerase sigma factor SigF n=1 Tax=Actinoplanes sp. (strain N902-109) TaxID=649831 RepID=UPI0003295706|nr:RNA polymerase sigma factor SigF [Actinoplanes sp. N902-109]AGL20862.1 sig b/f/g subfamily RNA polymerase sigma-28 subunit [Actinoplanes sp. N902-109]